MPYRIGYSRDADADLAHLRRTDGAGAEAAIRKAIQRYLIEDPTLGSGARKELAPNPIEAGWRLRIGDYRAYYDVDAEARLVLVLRVGYKPRETLYLRGRPTAMRLD